MSRELGEQGVKESIVKSQESRVNGQESIVIPCPFVHASRYNALNPTPGCSTEGTSARNWLRNALAH